MIVRELVTRALNRSALVGVDTPPAREIENAIDRLNEMLAAWALEGMDLRQPVLAADDTIYIDPAYVKAVVDNLAIELAVDHGSIAELSPIVARGAETGKETLRASLLDLDDLTVDRALCRGGCWYDYTRG